MVQLPAPKKCPKCGAESLCERMDVRWQHTLQTGTQAASSKVKSLEYTYACNGCGRMFQVVETLAD